MKTNKLSILIIALYSINYSLDLGDSLIYSFSIWDAMAPSIVQKEFQGVPKRLATITYIDTFTLIDSVTKNETLKKVFKITDSNYPNSEAIVYFDTLDTLTESPKWLYYLLHPIKPAIDSSICVEYDGRMYIVQIYTEKEDYYYSGKRLQHFISSIGTLSYSDYDATSGITNWNIEITLLRYNDIKFNDLPEKITVKYKNDNYALSQNKYNRKLFDLSGRLIKNNFKAQGAIINEGSLLFTLNGNCHLGIFNKYLK